jgi:hypothetical protein
LIADVGGWTGTLIGIRYALYVEKIVAKHISYCRAYGVISNYFQLASNETGTKQNVRFGLFSL